MTNRRKYIKINLLLLKWKGSILNYWVHRQKTTGRDFFMNFFKLRGAELLDSHNRRIAITRGEDIYDANNRRIATIRGNFLFDSDNRKMMTVRGANIYDAANMRVASLLEAQKSIPGALAGMRTVALWYCFIR
jgi:hypothetical protein